MTFTEKARRRALRLREEGRRRALNIVPRRYVKGFALEGLDGYIAAMRRGHLSGYLAGKQPSAFGRKEWRRLLSHLHKLPRLPLP
jgi:hypothetical protein